MNDVLKRIYDYSLEEIMGERFGRYSKTIIQNRAIPDVRDGLKPVQRRILFAMYKERNTYEKPYRKSAKTVGYVIGNYHPHGDSSVYEALVRMSQSWKQKEPYVDMQGNNGSIDGDGPAAMRYTEARLAKISNELLKDLEKDTVLYAPTFDDSELEPTVLPAKFPNLLVNGTTGISAGYATNIPPHNLSEVIDATIKLIDKPDCSLDDILTIVKGPDFPTGGIAIGADGLRKAYETGRGKILLRSKIEVTKNQIIVTEIPYETLKSNIVKKIDDIRIDKRIDGISDVRDESDKTGLRIAVDLKKGANSDLILNYLLKNTDLQISYNFNMVAIVNRRPKELGIKPILEAYIAHQREVIRKRSAFDLRHAEARLHIVEGLIKALSILDQVIKTIRESKNKRDAVDNLIQAYDFTREQADAIVMLQLYKLTNTDVTELMNEASNLRVIIEGLRAILEDETRMKKVMIEELKKIKKEYGRDRLTQIEAEVEEIKIDDEMLIPRQEVVVVVTSMGYVKRISKRSFNAAEGETTLKEGDHIIGYYEMNTIDTLLLFTDLGNYLYVPVHKIPDNKFKEIGKHISNIVNISASENIIGSMPVTNFKEPKRVTIFTKNGMVKRSELKDFDVQRYSKPIMAIKLKGEDRVISIDYSDQTEVFIATNSGYGLWYDVSEIPVVGLKTSGVKSMALKGDHIVSAFLFDQTDAYITVVTDKNTMKRVKLSDFEKTSRARRGVLLIKQVKTNPYQVRSVLRTDNHMTFQIKTEAKDQLVKPTAIPIMDRVSKGSELTKDPIIELYPLAELQTVTSKETSKVTQEVQTTQPEPEKTVSLEEIDTKFYTIDDFLNEIED